MGKQGTDRRELAEWAERLLSREIITQAEYDEVFALERVGDMVVYLQTLMDEYFMEQLESE